MSDLAEEKFVEQTLADIMYHVVNEESYLNS